MEIRILGSAAGGGFPQWNCNCHNCAGLRQGTLQARPRTQSSIAVSADSLNWVLFNASHDIRTQILSFSALGPGRAIRGTGMVAVLLMDSQIDHTAGLLTLREGRSLEIYCTDRVYQDLTRDFPLFNLLGHYCEINHHPIPIDGSSFTVPGAQSLRLTALPLRSKAPLILPIGTTPNQEIPLACISKIYVPAISYFMPPAWASLRRICGPHWKDRTACWWMVPSGARMR